MRVRHMRGRGRNGGAGVSRVARWPLAAVTVLALVALVAGCTGNGDAAGGGAIPAGDAVSLTGGGLLAADGVAVEVADGAFDADAEVSLRVSDQVPGALDAAEAVGPSIHVEVDGAAARSQLPTEVRIPIDADEVDATSEVWFGYFHPDHGWHLYPADAVDLDTGMVTFSTYHFSWFTPLRVQRQRQAEDAIERHTLEEYVRRYTAHDHDAQVEAAVDAIMRDAVGVADSRAIEIITRAVLDEIPGGSLAQAIHDGDLDAFTGLVADHTAGAVTDHLGDADSDLAALLRDTPDIDVDALDAATGGDTQQLLEHLSTRIVENTPVVSTLANVFQTGREVIDDVINNVWKDRQVQNAFIAYRDGADGGRFGLNVDAGDWNQLTAQMRGLGELLQAQAVAAHAAQHGIATHRIDTETRNQLGDQALRELRERFDGIIERQPELDQIAQAQREILEHLGDRYLRPTSSNPLYREGLNDSVEHFTGRIFDTVRRVQRIAGQVVVPDQADMDNVWEIELSSVDVARAIEAAYNAPPGQQDDAIRQTLMDRGILDPEPDLDLSGSYRGTMEITEVFVAESGEQCDLDEADAAPAQLELTLHPDDDGGGTVDAVIVTPDERITDSSTLSWSADEVRFTVAYPAGALDFTGTPQAQEDDTVRLSGSLRGTAIVPADIAVNGIDTPTGAGPVELDIHGTWQAAP